MGVGVIASGSDTDIETEGEATTGTEPKEEFAPENQLAVVQQRAVSNTRSSKAATERSDDPLRIYLRDMGSMELLSREGEVAVAKRIEAGRDAMMAGLCESPLTFQAIIIWRDELYDGKVLLRDIIDLDATNSDRGVKILPAPRSDIEAGDPIGAGTPTGQEAVSEGDIDEDDMQKWLSITLWRRSSNRRCSRPSITSWITLSGSAACKNSTFRVS